jgi:hypothetical protein
LVTSTDEPLSVPPRQRGVRGRDRRTENGLRTAPMNRDWRGDTIEKVEDPLKPVSQVGDCDSDNLQAVPHDGSTNGIGRSRARGQPTANLPSCRRCVAGEAGRRRPRVRVPTTPPLDPRKSTARSPQDVGGLSLPSLTGESEYRLAPGPCRLSAVTGLSTP